MNDIAVNDIEEAAATVAVLAGHTPNFGTRLRRYAHPRANQPGGRLFNGMTISMTSACYHGKHEFCRRHQNPFGCVCPNCLEVAGADQSILIPGAVTEDGVVGVASTGHDVSAPYAGLQGPPLANINTRSGAKATDVEPLAFHSSAVINPGCTTSGTPAVGSFAGRPFCRTGASSTVDGSRARAGRRPWSSDPSRG